MRKCSSISCAAAQEREEVLAADGDGERDADGGPHANSGRRPSPTSGSGSRDARRTRPSPCGSRTRRRNARAPPARPACSSSHARAVRALVSVSSVVNVFEAMMNSVVCGSAVSSTSARRQPSTFETNAHRGAARGELRAAPRTAIAGPEIRAADADVHDEREALASSCRRCCRCAPWSAKSSMRSRSASTSFSISAPPMPRAARLAQRHVQHGAPLGGVDRIAAPHRLDALAQRHRIRERARAAPSPARRPAGANSRAAGPPLRTRSASKRAGIALRTSSRVCTAASRAACASSCFPDGRARAGGGIGHASAPVEVRDASRRRSCSCSSRQLRDRSAAPASPARRARTAGSRPCRCSDTRSTAAGAAARGSRSRCRRRRP